VSEPHQILIVEDDESIAEVLVDTLKDEGYSVRLSANGRDALGVLEGWLPDLIMLDLMMPVMDGWSFRSAQRQLPGRAGRVPVLVLTGAREARLQAGNLAADAVITKPFELDEVVRTVGRLCRGQMT
jgi:CheY-like chemotaxis protein